MLRRERPKWSPKTVYDVIHSGLPTGVTTLGLRHVFVTKAKDGFAPMSNMCDSRASKATNIILRNRAFQLPLVYPAHLGMYSYAFYCYKAQPQRWLMLLRIITMINLVIGLVVARLPDNRRIRSADIQYFQNWISAYRGSQFSHQPRSSSLSAPPGLDGIGV